MEQNAKIFSFGEFELDEGLFGLRRSGAPVSLQPKPLSLLIYLVRNRVRLVSKDELLDEVWPNVVVSETALTSALRDVRRALGDKATPPQLIETVRGRGYRFVAEVEERSASADEPAPCRSHNDSEPPPGLSLWVEAPSLPNSKWLSGIFPWATGASSFCREKRV